MRWKGRRQSQNVEDQRGASGGPPMVLAGGGLGGLIILVIALFLGINPAALMAPGNNPAGPGPAGPGQPPANESPEDRERREFIGVVLADTEDVWNSLLPTIGAQYEEPRLRLFTGQVQSACGFASAAVGPFYCPADRRVFIDLSFYDELKEKFRAPGDFAQAYVIAHEVGHHIQNLLGISGKVHRAQQASSKGEANALSVRLELQADYLAGVWAHHAQRMKNILEPGDVEEALQAASAIGDDRLQMQTQGYVVPDSFTHGSSEQRVRWFRRGLQTGDLEGMNVLFETDDL